MRTGIFSYPVLILAAALAGGCGADKAEQKQAATGVIPEYQLNALEEAQGVEDQLEESLQRRAEQAEDE